MSRHTGSHSGNRNTHHADHFQCIGLIDSIEEAYDHHARRFVVQIHLKHDKRACLPLSLDAYLCLYPALQEMQRKSHYVGYIHYNPKPGRPTTNSIDLNSVAPYNTEKVQRKYELAHQAMTERLGDSNNPEKLYEYIRRRSGKK